MAHKIQSMKQAALKLNLNLKKTRKQVFLELSGTRFTGRASISIMQPIAAQLNGTAPRKLQVQYC